METENTNNKIDCEISNTLKATGRCTKLKSKAQCRQKIVQMAVKCLMAVTLLEYEYRHFADALTEVHKFKAMMTDCVDEHTVNSAEFWNHIKCELPGEFALEIKE